MIGFPIRSVSEIRSFETMAVCLPRIGRQRIHFMVQQFNSQRCRIIESISVEVELSRCCIVNLQRSGHEAAHRFPSFDSHRCLRSLSRRSDRLTDLRGKVAMPTSASRWRIFPHSWIPGYHSKGVFVRRDSRSPVPAASRLDPNRPSSPRFQEDVFVSRFAEPDAVIADDESEIDRDIIPLF